VGSNPLPPPSRRVYGSRRANRQGFRRDSLLRSRTAALARSMIAPGSNSGASSSSCGLIRSRHKNGDKCDHERCGNRPSCRRNPDRFGWVVTATMPPHSSLFLAVRDRVLSLSERDRARLAALFGAMTSSPSALGRSATFSVPLRRSTTLIWSGWPAGSVST
jgi:hypothetical protein